MERLTMTVKEMGEIMGLSLPKAYELTEVDGFPLLRVGRKKLIPVEGLKRWLEENTCTTKQN